MAVATLGGGFERAAELRKLGEPVRGPGSFQVMAGGGQYGKVRAPQRTVQRSHFQRAVVEILRAERLKFRRRIRIAVQQEVVRVYRGGGLAGEVRLPAGGPTEGKIRLGINVEADGGRSPFTVDLADLEVRSL